MADSSATRNRVYQFASIAGKVAHRNLGSLAGEDLGRLSAQAIQPSSDQRYLIPQPHQKLSFNANWIMRGPPLVEVICPNAGAATLAFGCEKFTSLNALKNSVRNSALNRSVTGMNFTMLKSTLCCPGPIRKFRGDVPYGATFAQPGANAAVLKYSFSLLFVDPGSVNVDPAITSARFSSVDGISQTTEKGNPLCSVMIVASSQLFAARRSAPDSPL